MITYLEAAGREDYLAMAAADPVLGARIHTITAAYGLDSRLADHWLAVDEAGRPTASLLRFGDCLSVAAGGGADAPELAAFIQAVGGVCRVEAAPALCRALWRRLGGCLRQGPVMVCREPGSLNGGVSDEPPLEAVYRLLRASFPELPGWEDWYPHASYLLRHRLGFAAAVREGERVVCTGGVWTQGCGFGVISGIVTQRDSRARGHARRLVAHLCARCMERGLEPVLCCEEELAGFYRRLNFEVQGAWGQLRL